MPVRPEQVLWKLSFSWLNDMTDDESAEGKVLLSSIVADWMERLKELRPDESPEEDVEFRRSQLNKRLEGDAIKRLEILRLEVFRNRLNRTTYRAYNTARQIIDGVVAREKVAEEGKRLMEEIAELRKEAAIMTPDNTSVDMDLSEAFLEANFIWRGGGMSMRLGNYARTKSGR